MSKSRKYSILIALLFAMSLLMQIYTTSLIRLNPDVFFLINNGRHMIATGTLFPRFAFSTIHGGFDVVLQQPLSDIALFLSYEFLGVRGVLLLSVFCFIVCFLLIYLYAYNLKGASKLLFLSAVVLLLPYAFIGRPFMFTAILMLSSLNILERVKRSELDDNFVLCLIPVLLLQLLFHSAFFLVHLVMCACFLAPKNDVMSRASIIYRLKLLSVLVLTFSMSFATPYKSRLPLYLFYSYDAAADPTLSITELRAPTLFSPYGIYALAIVALLIYMTRKADGIHYLLAFFAFCFLILHRRNFIVATLFLMPLIKDFFMFIETNKAVADIRIGRSSFLVPAVAAIIVFGICFYRYPLIAVPDSANSPVKAAGYLKDKENIILYNDFNSGAYLEFMGYDTYIDARPELYTYQLNGSKDLLIEYMKLRNDPDYDFEGFIEGYGFTHLITDKRTFLYMYLSSSREFVKVIDYNGYALFEKE